MKKTKSIYECVFLWNTPNGKSPARTSLVQIWGGRGRHYAQECEDNLYNFETNYQTEDWFNDYIEDKHAFIKQCVGPKRVNPNYRGHAEGFGGKRTSRMKKFDMSSNITRKNKMKIPENRLITINYYSANSSLSEEEKKTLIKNIKKQKYYNDYLSGKFRYVFIDKIGFTEGRFLWKGGAGHWGEASDRVLDILLGDFDVLPAGVRAEPAGDKEVSFLTLDKS